jgi:hypothetical protein
MFVSRYHHNTEVLAAQGAAAAVMHFIRPRNSKRGSRYGSAAHPRRRLRVEEIHQCLGANYFKRAYRMSYKSFWRLHDELKDGIMEAYEQSLEKAKKGGLDMFIVLVVVGETILLHHQSRMAKLVAKLD